MEFAPYAEPQTHARLQIIRGTELEVDVSPVYGDVTKAKKYYRVLHTNQAALDKWTNALHPKLPSGDLYVFGHGVEPVK